VADHPFFLLGFCFLLAHEMDAVRLREWKMLPVLSGMGEEAGYRAFVLLHVPLYALFSGGSSRAATQASALWSSWTRSSSSICCSTRF
jgi:hypothetical protein